MADAPGSGDDLPRFVRPGDRVAVDTSQPAVPTFQPPLAGGDRFATPAEESERPWPWWMAFVVLGAALLAVIGAGVVLSIVLELVNGGDSDAIDDYDYLFGLLQDTLWIAVVVAVPLMVVRWIRPEHLGLRSRRPGPALGKAAVVIVAFYLLAAVYAGLLGLDEGSNELLQDTGFGDTLAKDVIYAVVYAIAAPVAEELLFRGVVFKALRDGLRAAVGRRTAVAIAALLSGSVFGLAHVGGGQDDFIPVLIALGVLLAVAYEWSGTLYVPILIHSVNNAIATGSSADPTADWIFGLIAAAPVLAVLTAVGVRRIVQRLPAAPPPGPPPSTRGPDDRI